MISDLISVKLVVLHLYPRSQSITQLQGMMQLEPSIAVNVSVIDDLLHLLCFRGLSALLAPPSASGASNSHSAIRSIHIRTA